MKYCELCTKYINACNAYARHSIYRRALSGDRRKSCGKAGEALHILKERKLFHKMFMSYVVIVGCTIAIISGILFSFFRHNSTREIELISTQMLQQTGASSQYMNQQVESLMHQLQSEPEILRFLHLTRPDKAVEYAAYLKLRKYQALFSYINHIGLYNASLGRYLTTQGIPDDNPIVTEYLRGRDGADCLLFLPNRIQNPYDSNEFEGALTTISYLTRRGAEQPFAALVIHVNERYIHNMIAALGIGQIAQDDIFVVNREGIVLSHVNSSEFMKDYSDNAYLREILLREETAGSFQEKVDGEKSLVSFAKTTSPDWIYVSVRNYRTVAGNITALLRLVIAVAAGILAAGVAAGFLFAKRIYNPIQRLLRKLPGGRTAPRDEIAYLDRILDETLDLNRQLEKTALTGTRAIREQRLRSALSGREPLSREDEGAAFFGEEAGARFWVAAVQIDGYADLSRDTPVRDLSLVKYAIRNVTDELLGSYGRCESLDMRENLIVAAVASREEPDPRELMGKLERIRQVLAEAFDISLSMGVGKTETDPALLNRSYLSAVEAVEHKVFYGKGSILTAERIAERTPSAGLYPARQEKGIIESVNQRNIPLIRIRVTHFVEQMRRCSYTDLIAFSTRLLTELNCKYVPALGADRDILLRNNYNAMLKLSHCESLEELARNLTDCCINICNILNDERENWNLRTVFSLKEYAEQYYTLPDVSLSAAADWVGLSKDYAGRLFKSAMGVSFNDYLNQMRMKQAYLLLTETGDTISEISERIGIANHSYFYTLFRKYHGMTPSDCRRYYQVCVRQGDNT